MRLVDQIIHEVAEKHGVTVGELLNTRHKPAKVVAARHEAMRKAREVTRMSYPALGKAFGCHHTTVLLACRALSSAAEERKGT